MKEDKIIHIIFMAMLHIKKFSEADYHKTIVDEGSNFEKHHALLLQEYSKPDYQNYKKKAIEYYIDEYKDVLSPYQVEYVNDPTTIDIDIFKQECLEDAYRRFYNNYDYVLKSYKQVSAKKKRIMYLLEHTDIFIEIAKKWNNDNVIHSAQNAKEEYMNLLDKLKAV